MEMNFAHDGSTTTGLTYGYLQGSITRSNDLSEIAAGTILATANTSQTVYLDLADDTIKIGTTVPSTGIEIAALVSDGTRIISTIDRRTWVSFAQGGVTGFDGFGTQVATIGGATIWYRFDTSIVNSGSVPGHNLTNINGDAAVNDVPSSTEDQNGVGFTNVGTSSFKGLEGIGMQGTLPGADNGSVFIVLRRNTSGSLGYIFDQYLGFDSDNIALRVLPNGDFTYFTSDGLASNDDFTRDYTNTAFVESQTDFDTVCLVKNSDANPPTFYFNGVEQTVFIDSAEISDDPGRWFNDFEGLLSIGARGDPRQDAPEATLDEMVYFESKQLTQQEITDLHNSKGTPAPTNLSDMLKGKYSMYMLNGMENTASPVPNEGLVVQRIDAVTTGTVTLNQAGWGSTRAMSFPGGTGNSLVTNNVSFQPNYSSGFIIAHFNTSDQTVAKDIYMNSNTGGGTHFELRMDANGDMFFETQQFSGATFAYTSINTIGGLDDGNWHQVILSQLGLGVTWYIDGIKYTSADAEVTDTLLGTGAVSNWMDILSGGANPATRVAIGSASDTSNVRSWNGLLNYVGISRHHLTDTQASEIYNRAVSDGL